MTAGGTPPYMAPELLNPEKFGEKSSRPTKPADMYAFGMVIYEVLTGLDPFHHKKDIGVYSFAVLVVKGTRPTKPGNAEEVGLGKGTWELVRECWKAKSTKRPTIELALAHLAHASGYSAAPDHDPRKFWGPSIPVSSHYNRKILTLTCIQQVCCDNFCP